MDSSQEASIYAPEHSIALPHNYAGLTIACRIVYFSSESLCLVYCTGAVRQGEEKALRGLGATYYSLGDYPKAIEFQQQHLAIAREIGDRDGEAIGLNNLADTLEKQNQPALAIVFYKQAVNIRESIRKNLRSLSTEQQKTYTETVSYSYRNLAGLLLQQIVF
jgi:tetratricopeptide (TPR) repeat protein